MVTWRGGKIGKKVKKGWDHGQRLRLNETDVFCTVCKANEKQGGEKGEKGIN